MKCGNCKLWKYDLQPGTCKKDKRREFKIFGKVLGFCCCNLGGNYPMFNYEKCPRSIRKRDVVCK